MNYAILATLLGGIIGGFHNIVRTRQRAEGKGNLWTDIVNLFAGIFFALAAVDALVPPERLMWMPFAAMAAGSIGGYIIDTLAMVAPQWLTQAIPMILDRLFNRK